MCIRFNAIEIYVQAPSIVYYIPPFSFFFLFEGAPTHVGRIGIAPFSISSIGGQEKKKGLVVWGCSRKSPMKIDFNTHSRGIFRWKNGFGQAALWRIMERSKKKLPRSPNPQVFWATLFVTRLFEMEVLLSSGGVMSRAQNVCLLTGRQPLPL